MADKHEKEIDGLLRKIPFFAGLSETERAEVGEALLFRNFRRNDIILHEEETSRCLYLICSGKVKILQISAEGEEQILAIHRKGDFFGEMALLDGRTAPATVIALEETRIGLISRETFTDHLRTNGKVVEGIIALLCARLREAWLKIRVIGFADADQRLRAVLMDIGGKFGVRDRRGVIITLGITHQNIARLASTSRETATRFLNRTRREGEIEILAGKKILLKPPFLKKAPNL
ncbi:MAG: hypothetical protein AUK26_10495 [Syntrophaceae bacterium CG2_30_58_14]|nr:MAG: hypothetical protein AUK26_10495 [Syntrophaceae bacterium CG2_30_58_14]